MSELINISLLDKPDITDVQDNFNTLNNDKLEVGNINQGENITLTVDGKNITISATGGGGTGVDGVGLQYTWDGTSLGIKREDEINYTYANLKGQDGIIGVDGKSAYQSWLDLGNTGTEQDFINSVKGENGLDGVDGENGKNIEMRYSETYLQYRLVGDVDWINLIQLTQSEIDLINLTSRVDALEVNQGDLTAVPTELQNKTIAEMITTNFTSVSNGKTLVANAITDKGISTLATDTFQVMADNIGLISGGVISEYGIEINFPTESFTRMGASVGSGGYSDIDIWKLRRCNVLDNGTVTAYYGDIGYIEDGSNGQVMVEIPKFYYRTIVITTTVNPNGVGLQLEKVQYWICKNPLEGYKLHPNFKDANGNQVEHAYMSAYEGCIYDVSASSYLLSDQQLGDFTIGTGDKLSSRVDTKPCSGSSQNLTITNGRKIANNRGLGWEQQDINMVSAIQLLFLIEYASFDMQGKIGLGVVNKATGATNQASLTGETTNLGNASGMASGTNGLVSISYRGIENFWGNIWTLVDGINIQGSGSNLFYISNFNGNYKDNYNGIGYASGFALSKGNGFGDRVGYTENIDYLFMATRVLGSSSKPLHDNFYQNNTFNGFMLPLLGGSWDSGLNSGGFNWSCSTTPNTYGAYMSTRLIFRK